MPVSVDEFSDIVMAAKFRASRQCAVCALGPEVEALYTRLFEIQDSGANVEWSAKQMTALLAEKYGFRNSCSTVARHAIVCRGRNAWKPERKDGPAPDAGAARSSAGRARLADESGHPPKVRRR